MNKCKKHVVTGVVLLLMILLAIASSSNSDGGSDSSSSTKELNASVQFTGTQFVITNKDSFDWKNVKLEVNSQGLKSGYILRTSLIEAGQTYTVGAAQFAKKDGERFNPFSHKATNFSIWCDLSGGTNGHYYGEWN